MQSSNIPSKIPLPFGYAAGSGYINTIPAASQIGVVNGRASLHDGFPPDTFIPIASGGVPPFGGDVNGILNEITAIQQWQEAGGFFPFDATFAATVGGYPLGAVIQSSSHAGFWVSTIENNTNNPDTGGAGWVPDAWYGSQTIAMSGTSVSISNIQAAYPILTLTGALTSNCNLIIPNFIGKWIISNNTSGSYTVQAKTSAGTGVNLAQGASTYIYGDGTNIYFADAFKVASFNGRTGTVTLNATDVVNALGYTPANINSPSFTGNPQAPTPALGDNSQSLATTQFVQETAFIRAWVNFSGYDGSIQNSFNISSVSRTGTGNYTITLASPMPNVNYVILVTPRTTADGAIRVIGYVQNGSITTTQFGVTTHDLSYYWDCPNVYVAIIG